MASMADYMVLHDGPFELKGNLDSKTVKFQLPEDFTVGTNFGKPILCFIVNPRSDNVTLHGGVNTEGKQSQSEIQLTFKNPPHFDQALWEAISGTEFKVKTENTCDFRTVGSSSHVIIRDVILWFQRGSGA